MGQIKFSLRTLVLLCLTIGAASLTAISLVPRFCGAYIIAQWRGQDYGGVDYISAVTSGAAEDPQWYGYMRSFRGLGRTGVRVLCNSLKSRDYCQRINILIALQYYGPEAAEAVPLLIPMLDEQDSYLRAVVIGCLMTIGNAARPAIPKLKQLQTQLDEHDADETTSKTILSMAIHEINHPTIVANSDPFFDPPFLKAFDPNPWPQGLPWIVRQAVPLGINAWIVGVTLALLFGGMFNWSFLSDRRYFRQLLEAKHAAGIGRIVPTEPTAGTEAGENRGTQY